MVNTTITTNTKRHASSWETAADVDRIDTDSAMGKISRLTDSSALTIAAGWQTPGSHGRAFAELASTGQIGLSELATDIQHAWQHAKTDEGRYELDLLLLWAYSHPSCTTDDEEDCSYDD